MVHLPGEKNGPKERDVGVEITTKYEHIGFKVIDDWKEVPIGDFTFYDPPYRNSFADYNTAFDDTETEVLITRVEENKNVWLCNRDSGDGFFENRKATLKKFPVTYTAGRRKKTENGFAAKKATEILLFN